MRLKTQTEFIQDQEQEIPLENLLYFKKFQILN